MPTDETPMDLVQGNQGRPLRVLLATTWDTPCGIAEHSRMLIDAVEAIDPAIQITPSVDLLVPGRIPDLPINLLHLNYQANLHSRWTPAAIEAWKATTNTPVLVTYHDTGVPNSDQCQAVIAAADAAVVHEPFDDLPEAKTYYWRMGVPEYEGVQSIHPPRFDRWQRPYLGTVGFPFPWKCYDELCRVTESVGWGLLLLAPTATREQIQTWQRLNPFVAVVTEFLPQREVVGALRNCDATAFTYVTHNTGQSGAILQGIAARKPVIALETCRQFRALYADVGGQRAIRWARTFDDVQRLLGQMILERLDTGIVALAHQDRWSLLGQKYAALYRSLAEAR